MVRILHKGRSDCRFAANNNNRERRPVHPSSRDTGTRCLTLSVSSASVALLSRLPTSLVSPVLLLHVMVVELGPRVSPAPAVNDTIIQLKLHNRCVDFWKRRYKDRVFAIKITPVSLREQGDDATPDIFDGQESSNINDHLQDGSSVKVCALNDHEAAPRPQGQFGHRYDPDEFVIFLTDPMDAESVTFMVDFYAENDENGCPIPERIGFGYILPSNLRGTSGACTMPITGKKHLPIGQLSGQCLPSPSTLPS